MRLCPLPLPPLPGARSPRPPSAARLAPTAHDSIALGFNTFLPPGYRIELAAERPAAEQPAAAAAGQLAPHGRFVVLHRAPGAKEQEEGVVETTAAAAAQRAEADAREAAPAAAPPQPEHAAQAELPAPPQPSSPRAAEGGSHVAHSDERHSEAGGAGALRLSKRARVPSAKARERSCSAKLKLYGAGYLSAPSDALLDFDEIDGQIIVSWAG